ncbi:MAG: XrtA-associated tyrosine autokinase [Gammaproteobacteria bacterium]
MSIIQKALEQSGKVRAKEHRQNDPISFRKKRAKPVYLNAAPRHRLDLRALARKGIYAEGDLALRAAAEYRQIKRPLLDNALNKGPVRIENGNVIMVTSSVPGEGKTFTAINLALSMALEQDSTVLLVDADVTKRDTSNLLNVDNAPGLMDVLLPDSDVALEDVLLRTDNLNLVILPAGQRHSNAAELLASRQMELVVRELAARYPDRIILLDSPPLLAGSEARILNRFVGQVVMVVAAVHTLQQVFHEATAQLDPDKPTGVVLNKSQRFLNSDYYYGYYGNEAG